MVPERIRDSDVASLAPLSAGIQPATALVVVPTTMQPAGAHRDRS